MKPVTRTREPAERLAEVAYRAIVDALFDRRIGTGAFVSQNDLVELLGVPIQPLRDALRVLEGEGILTIHPRSGIEFLKADLELARSTYQFRSIIERAAARAFAETADTGEVQAMIAAHEALRKRIAAEGKTGETDVALEAVERRFHGALLGSLRNPLIERSIGRLNTYVALLRMDRRDTPPLMQRTLIEHIAVLEACLAHDADAAEAALAQHFQAALQRTLGMN